MEESVNDTYLDAWNSMPPHNRVVIWAKTDKYGYLYLFTVNGEV